LVGSLEAVKSIAQVATLTFAVVAAVSVDTDSVVAATAVV